jgi:hypothetical protein
MEFKVSGGLLISLFISAILNLMQCERAKLVECQRAYTTPSDIYACTRGSVPAKGE